MAAPAHTGMLSVTAINDLQCFALQLQCTAPEASDGVLRVDTDGVLYLACIDDALYRTNMTYSGKFMYHTMQNTKDPPADIRWQSIGGY